MSILTPQFTPSTFLMVSLNLTLHGISSKILLTFFFQILIFLKLRYNTVVFLIQIALKYTDLKMKPLSFYSFTFQHFIELI